MREVLQMKQPWILFFKIKFQGKTKQNKEKRNRREVLVFKRQQRPTGLARWWLWDSRWALRGHKARFALRLRGLSFPTRQNPEIAMLSLPTSHQSTLGSGTWSTASIHPLISSRAINRGKKTTTFSRLRNLSFWPFSQGWFHLFHLTSLPFLSGRAFMRRSQCVMSQQSDKNVTFRYELSLPSVPSFPSGISLQQNNKKIPLLRFLHPPERHAFFLRSNNHGFQSGNYQWTQHFVCVHTCDMCSRKHVFRYVYMFL